jgi:hypothetical protein
MEVHGKLLALFEVHEFSAILFVGHPDVLVTPSLFNLSLKPH